MLGRCVHPRHNPPHHEITGTTGDNQPLLLRSSGVRVGREVPRGSGCVLNVSGERVPDPETYKGLTP